MSDAITFLCEFCQRPWTSKRGLGVHKASCKFRPNALGDELADSSNNGGIENITLNDFPNINTENPDENSGNSDDYSNIEDPNFLWGEKSGKEFTKELNTIYDKIVFYKQNIFKLPSGTAGKNYIREVTRLVRAWTTNSELKNVAWKCIMIMPCLLLQKPSKDSKSKDHSVALKRRLLIWQNGNLFELLKECDTIQNRIKSSNPRNTSEAISKKFASLMKQGKVNAAVKLLTNSMEGGILPLDTETMNLLRSKHPEPADLNADAIFDQQAPEVHPIVFDSINADSVRSAALNTHGGAGPSGVDADGWRHILVSRNFGLASEELREAFAAMIKILCTEKVELVTSNDHVTSSIEAFLACRLIPLDKRPGVRPIGVGEVLRRIAGKVFMSVVKGDVQECAGSIQVCAGQDGGSEAAIHAMRTIYEDVETDGVLLIDAANAFNSINRAVMLQNIGRICPIVYTYAYNCYSVHARLFVLGGGELRSKEGTTQGDPPSMAFYAIGSLPLIWCLADHERSQVAYADDFTGGGKLNGLRKYFDRIVDRGPLFGYYAEPSKSWLIVKEEKLDEAKVIFDGTGVNITSQGKKHLGAVIGHPSYKREFVSELVEKWVVQVKALADIALFEPHAAYTAFTSCIRHRYSFYLRTIPDISDSLQPLEEAIRFSLVAALTEGRQVSDDERKLLSLPPRLGGMGIVSPVQMCNIEHEFSKGATESLTNAIKNQQKDLPQSFSDTSKQARLETRKKRREIQSEHLEDLRSRMSVDQKRANEISCEVGASNWLTALPIEQKGFHLNKREFWDAVNLRYGWPFSRFPSKCACGDTFNLSHALSCKKGGFVTQRHNELRDMTADLLAEVCHDVSIEPMLNGLSGEQLSYASSNKSPEARLDISARGVWLKNQRAFFDVRVFYPNARRFKSKSLKQTYVDNEKDKKRAYNERVLQVENGTFTPLVFSVFGGMGEECKVFYKRLASMISEKRSENLASVSSWIRTRTSFALLRSALMCLRGSRHRYHRSNIPETDMELDLKETAIRPV